MDKARYNYLMKVPDATLTQKEVDEGWHFCWDWDGLLIHTSDLEYDCCSCPNRPTIKRKE